MRETPPEARTPEPPPPRPEVRTIPGRRPPSTTAWSPEPRPGDPEPSNPPSDPEHRERVKAEIKRIVGTRTDLERWAVWKLEDYPAPWVLAIAKRYFGPGSTPNAGSYYEPILQRWAASGRPEPWAEAYLTGRATSRGGGYQAPQAAPHYDPL